MATVAIPESWTPTAENLYALPKPLRRYIHDLEASADPVETMRENFRLRQENAALRKLAGTLSEIRPFFADHFFSDRKVNAYRIVGAAFANSEMSRRPIAP